MTDYSIDGEENRALSGEVLCDIGVGLDYF